MTLKLLHLASSGEDYARLLVLLVSKTFISQHMHIHPTDAIYLVLLCHNIIIKTIAKVGWDGLKQR